MPLPPEEVYTTDHRTKSWEDMIIMFKDFVKRVGHGNAIGEWTMSTASGGGSSGGGGDKRKVEVECNLESVSL